MSTLRTQSILSMATVAVLLSITINKTYVKYGILLVSFSAILYALGNDANNSQRTRIYYTIIASIVGILMGYFISRK